MRHNYLGPTAKNLRIRDIKAKGQYAEALQAKFDAIIRKAEFKLLDAATDILRVDVKSTEGRFKSKKRT